jgi:hypothetical protein
VASALIDAFEHVLRAEVGLELRRSRPGLEEVFVLEEGIDAAQSEAEEDAAGEGAALLAGDQHVGAGRAFGVLEIAVLLNDELAAQGNHEQYAQPAADQRQKEDARVLEIEAQKDQRGQRKDDARSDRLAGVAGGLDDIVLEDRGAAEGPQNTNRKHRDGDRGGHRESGPQAHVDGDPSKDDAEKRSQKNGAQSEFGALLTGRHKRLKDGRWKDGGRNVGHR